jgi:hypothetical protein
MPAGTAVTFLQQGQRQVRVRPKLKLPKMDQEGTVRNINTVTRLAGQD